MRDSAGVRMNTAGEPFPPLRVEGPTILLAGLLLVAILAIAVLALSYEISKLRGELQRPVATPAPAEQVLSPSDLDSPPPSAVIYPSPQRIEI